MWGAQRQLIEQALAGYLNAQTSAPPTLLAGMRYALLGPGKRIRPVLVLLAAEAVGGKAAAAVGAACAVEMVHTYSLVHDDLPAMDDDDLRRGRPTVHRQYGESMAILVGDALLTLAFQVMSQHVQPAALAATCCAELAVAAGPCGMVGGQVKDLGFEKRVGGLPELEDVHRCKTGALFRACVRIGGRIGTGSAATTTNEPSLLALDAYASHLGLAFQIADDLQDALGSTERTGKHAGKDAERGKLTYPGLLGIKESKQLLHETYGGAMAALAPLGVAATPLVDLVRVLAERDRS
jgi:geranylgeranyl diphosphate synthase type II